VSAATKGSALRFSKKRDGELTDTDTDARGKSHHLAEKRLRCNVDEKRGKAGQEGSQEALETHDVLFTSIVYSRENT